MTIDLRNAKAKLLELKSELQNLSRITADDRSAVQLDQQSVGRLSRMDALQRQAMAQAQDAARQKDLHRIDEALRRISEDEYGYCIDCGTALPARRLEIDPMAERCVNCAAR